MEERDLKKRKKRGGKKGGGWKHEGGNKAED